MPFPQQPRALFVAFTSTAALLVADKRTARVSTVAILGTVEEEQ